MAAETIRLLEADGTFAPNAAAQEYLPYFEKLTEADFRTFYRDMSVVRAFDVTATNLQRQGQLSLWVPSYGQEAAQIGSAHASAPQDHIFPSYREHGVGLVRGIDLMGIMALLRGTTHGGWNPEASNFHNYTLVIGTQTLHATGYAMGVKFDAEAAGVDNDSAVIVYFGDGATSQGDVHESLVFATSYQTPQLFFLQNNQWAISVPVSVQANAPLYQRALGYGMPSVQIDGNDVFASFAVTAKHLEDIRAGKGPAYIEALTYRMGAHTTTDDPTRYRTDDETASWARRDPIRRLEVYLRGLGVEQGFFDDVETEGADLSARIRSETHSLVNPGTEVIFDHVYTDPHPVTAAQKQWLADYEESFHDDATEVGA